MLSFSVTLMQALQNQYQQNRGNNFRNIARDDKNKIEHVQELECVPSEKKQHLPLTTTFHDGAYQHYMYVQRCGYSPLRGDRTITYENSIFMRGRRFNKRRNRAKGKRMNRQPAILPVLIPTNMKPHPNEISLPRDIIILLAGYLPSASDFMNLALTCKRYWLCLLPEEGSGYPAPPLDLLNHFCKEVILVRQVRRCYKFCVVNVNICRRFSNGDRHGESRTYELTTPEIMEGTGRNFDGNRDLELAKNQAMKVGRLSYSCTYVRGKKQGVEVIVIRKADWICDEIITNHWLRDKKHGQETTVVSDDGKLRLAASTNWIHGRKHGISERYFLGLEQTQLAHSVNFCHGKKDGPEEVFYDNGNLKKMTIWANGKRHRDVNEYDREGNLIAFTKYHHGDTIVQRQDLSLQQ